MDVVDLAGQLISFDSISSNSNLAISEFIADRLIQLAFHVERLAYRDSAGVEKLSLVAKQGTGSGGVALIGHTDVVPAPNWTAGGQGPFVPVVRNDRLYGRGSCDMKGAVACMLAAAERTSQPARRRPLYIVCTADEEVGYEGARQIAQRSELFQEMVGGNTRGVIGEPTGLTVVHGHKGSYAFRVIARGRAAHSSTREGQNANLKMIPFLAEMKRMHDWLEEDPAWHDSRFDPPTVSWNIGINDHTAAVNVTAAQSVCTVHFRPMPGQDQQQLLHQAQQAAERHGLEFELFHTGGPFYVDPEDGWPQAMLRLTRTARSVTVPYGTDASLLSRLPSLVICGPGDIAQAHTSDEWISLEQLQKGCDLYTRLIQNETA